MAAMAPVITQRIEVGSIVRIQAPGSRTSEGEERVIPAVVIGQWPNGSLQLYCLHFQGSPILANEVPLDQVEMVFSRSEVDAIFEGFNRRITELENHLASAGFKQQEPPPLKFAINDPH